MYNINWKKGQIKWVKVRIRDEVRVRWGQWQVVLGQGQDKDGHKDSLKQD